MTPAVRRCVHLTLFGHPAVGAGSSREALALPPKGVALLACLAANADRPVAREWLAALLWPDVEMAQARANLRRHVHLAMKALDAEVLVVSRHTVQWNAEAAVECDVVTFDRLRGVDAETAAELYIGDLCTGLLEPALDDLRTRYRARYEFLLRSQRDASRRTNDDEQLRRWLQRLVAFDPLDEDAVAELMKVRARNGDRAGALRDFAALRQRLNSEIGAEPAADTLALFSEIASGEATVSIATNLPNVATTFVGRERELRAIADALERHGSVALVGPGGAGKSRLAVRSAFEMLHAYPDGVWFVALDHARSETDVWEAVAQAMHLQIGSDARAEVLRTLNSSKTLIVFDTCERVGDQLATAIAELRGWGTTHVLATTRRRLNAESIPEIPIEGLELPPPMLAPDDTPLRYSAYRLFVERAALVNPSFRADANDVNVVRELLISIDALPLAIELVASRANLLTVRDLRRRLHEAMRSTKGRERGRHSTLEAALAWSFDLLGETERFVFCAIGMFQDSFCIDDVDEICGLPASAALFTLVDASLVAASSSEGDVRYRLLETTRAFARARLAERPERSDIERHYVERFSAAAGALAALPEDRYAQRLPHILRDMPDFLAALRLCAQHGWGAAGIHIVEGIYRFAIRYHYAAATREAGLELAHNTAISPDERARAMRLVATVCGNIESMPLFQAAIDHYRNTGNAVALGDALSALGATHYRLGDRDACERLLLEAKSLLDGHDDRRLILKTAVRLATLYDDYERKRMALQPAIESLLELGEVRQAAYQLKNLAAHAYLASFDEDAITWAERALELVSVTADQGLLMNLESIRGCAYARLGNIDASIRAHLQANEVAAVVGMSPESIECIEDTGVTLSRLGRFEAAARAFGFSERGRGSLDSPRHASESGPYDEALNAVREALGGRFEPLFWRGAEDDFETACRRVDDALTEQTL